MFLLNADTLNLTSCAFSCTNLATQDLATRVCKHQTWKPEPRPGVEPIRLRVSGSGFTWPALGKRQTRMARCSNGFRLCLGLVGFGFSVYGFGACTNKIRSGELVCRRLWQAPDAGSGFMNSTWQRTPGNETVRKVANNQNPQTKEFSLNTLKPKP